MTDEVATVVLKADKTQILLMVDALRGHAATLLARAEEADFATVREGLVAKALAMSSLAEDLKRQIKRTP